MLGVHVVNKCAAIPSIVSLNARDDANKGQEQRDQREGHVHPGVGGGQSGLEQAGMDAVPSTQQEAEEEHHDSANSDPTVQGEQSVLIGGPLVLVNGTQAGDESAQSS